MLAYFLSFVITLMFSITSFLAIWNLNHHNYVHSFVNGCMQKRWDFRSQIPRTLNWAPVVRLIHPRYPHQIAETAVTLGDLSNQAKSAPGIVSLRSKVGQKLLPLPQVTTAFNAGA